ncbi:MAG TPA: D-alanyl-D-alanine carboxypeptidase family protein [Syntrophomonadaceae bacterium]|nr:D-alanyl-D-alanine carboxypeptidase family protein [Syntrophomonadaceae bacterium]
MTFRRSTLGLLLLVYLFAFTCPTLSAAQDALDLKAESYVLMDADSGKLLIAKNENKRLPPASMTKLMTLILAAEDLEKGKAQLKDKVNTSENAWKMGGSQVYLEPGEQMSLEDMLIAIAVGSANDSCVAVAEYLEGSHQSFVQRMNQKASELGLKDTHFVNAYGLPAEGHYTSAYDMAVMGRYALSFPKILEYTSIKEYNLRQGKFKLYNTNKLLWWYQGADGFKTGWTDEAKHCLVATAKRDGLRLISVIMGTPEANGHLRESMQLLNYGFARYSFQNFFDQGNVCGVVQIGKGVEDSVEVVAEENVGCIIPKGDEKKVSYEKQVVPYVNAPVQEGQILGAIKIYRQGELDKTVNLVAARGVSRSSLWREIMKLFGETYLL